MTDAPLPIDPLHTAEPPASAGRLDDAALWQSLDVYPARYEKAAAGLVAIREVLRSDRPLDGGEDEFLALYERLADCTPASFTAVWTDPTAYFWTRVTYQLVASCVAGEALTTQADDYCRALGAQSPADALAESLRRFKGFVIAACALDGATLDLAQPLHISLPWALPGTRWWLGGTGERRIAGVRPGALQLTDGTALALRAGHRAQDITVAECPLASHGEVAIRLQWALFHDLPGLGFTAPAIDAGPDYQQQQVALTESTLALVARHHPSSHEQMTVSLDVLAYKPLHAGYYSNMSYSDLPGAFICGVIEQPYELADTFIHELHHNRLFFLEEDGPFLEPRDGVDPLDDRLYYSPWRDDPRPLHGILHAAYVYVPVTEFWMSVYGQPEIDAEVRAYAHDRVLRYLMQLQLGLHQLRSHAGATARGRDVIDGIARRLQSLHDTARTLPLDPQGEALRCEETGRISPERGPDEQPLRLHRALELHVERFAPDAQRAELLALLGDALETLQRGD